MNPPPIQPPPAAGSNRSNRSRRRPDLTLPLPQRNPSLAVPLPLPPSSAPSSTTTTTTTTSTTSNNNNSTNIMSFSELERVNRIGSGAGGTVYKVHHRPTGRIYALKVIYGNHEENVRRQICREIEILRDVDNPNVVKCFDMFDHNGEIQVLLEYMDGGSLEGKHISDEPSLAELSKQVLSGLVYLHKRRIVHRDIKPSNLLINCKRQVKIADFGVSRILAQTMDPCNSSVGTIAYMSPERINTDLNQGQYDGYAGDIWSLGVSILEFYLGRFPFAVGRQGDWASLMCAICMAAPPEAPPTASREFRDFISSCLQRDHRKRWTAAQLLSHPFILHNTSSGGFSNNHHHNNSHSQSQNNLEGLKLSKRLYYGKDRSIAPPKPPPPMSKNPRSYLPTAPMVYAVISDPGIVDNPDIPSYQPHVHGRCVPPALIPLQMNGISLEVDSYLNDTVFIRVSGQWRVHCVMGSKSCDCRIAIPMGEHGSILGVEVDLPRKSYRTQLIDAEHKRDDNKATLGADDGVFLKPDIFLLTIQEVDGGTNLSINISWAQKLSYHNGEFSLCVPFSFPEFVTPASKKIPKREKIQLNVHPGDGNEVLCKNISHPLKQQKRHVENLSFLYESDVLTWSSTDFSFSYSVPTNHISGSVLLQSPSMDDVDPREMFCIHILPGAPQDEKVFSRTIVYLIDTSGSMQGKPLEATKNALTASLSDLTPEDLFTVIAFNGQTFIFSSSLKPANKETIEDAVQWIGINFVAGDGTNISLAMNKALEILSDTRNSLPMIFLITDGAVQDERHICDTTKSRLSNWKYLCPRIHTFGIGSFCNHYFLRMLALIGHGHYDAAYDTDTIESRLQKLLSRASSTVLANIMFETLDELNNVEVYPTSVSDLSSENPLTISGRCSGNFPEMIKARGVAADMTNFEMTLKVHKAKEIPLEQILAMQQISVCTAQAWLSEDKELETKVTKLSIRNGIFSEYTSVALFMTETLKKEAEPGAKQKKGSSKGGAKKEDSKPQLVKVLRNLGVGFGNLKATVENMEPGFEEVKPPEAAEIIVKAASDCCTRMCGYCCCMCCIQACSKINNQCAIVLTQVCTAFACFGCLECCTEICCSGD